MAETDAKPTPEYRRFSRPLSRPLVFADLLPDAHPFDGLRTKDEHLEFDLRQAQRVLEQLSQAAEAFSVELDSRRLYTEIAYRASELLRADRTMVYAQGDHGPALAAHYPFDGGIPRAAHQAVVWCAKYLQPKVEHTTEYPGIRNLVCVPVVSSQHRLLGVIEACNKRTGACFTEADVRTAQCLARIASPSVDRATLFHRIEEWKQSIESLLTINATINQKLEPDEMVRQLVVDVCGFLNADGGIGGVVVRQDGRAAAVTDCLYFNGLVHRFDRTWKAGEGVPGTVMETEFPFLIDDYPQNPMAERELVDRYDISSSICVPIKNANEEVLGFFKLFRSPGRSPFTWQDAAFLESLGNTAAVAIENAHLVRSLELKNAQIKSLSQDHVRQLEHLRRQIARELHDQTGQMLVGLKLRLQAVSGLLGPGQEEAKRELSDLQVQINQAAGQLKDLAKSLRPPILDQLGFEASMRQLAAEYRRQVDFAIYLRFVGPSDLPGETATALFRIAQESLTNVAKHARATQVHIRLHVDENHRRFSIRDDGCGFDPDSATSGLGLIGIRERVRMLGGRFTIDSKPGEGTRLEIELPDRDET